MAAITYTNKSVAVDPQNPVDPTEKWKADDANEVKTVVNDIYYGNLYPTSQTDNYTLVLTDSFVVINKATSVNLTIPPNSSVAFPVNKYISVLQAGAGVITFVPGSGVTITASNVELTSQGANSIVGLLQISQNVWRLINGTSGTIVDWSSGVNPSGWASFTTKTCSYINFGKFVFITGNIDGTGNSGVSASFTLPIVPNATVYTGSNNVVFWGQAISSSSVLTGMVVLTGGSLTANVYSTVTGNGWTASTQRMIRFSFMYFI